jgi:hypothetical protein
MTDDQPSQGVEIIWELMAKFDTAVWKRIETSEEGAPAAFLKAKVDVYPKSAEEIAIWDEMTSPKNREALHQFFAYWSGKDLSDYAMRLNDALRVESDRRSGNGKDCHVLNHTYDP